MNTDLEQKAWDWLDRTVSAIGDEEPSDIAYSADQMVDAFLAGAASVLRTEADEIERRKRAESDAVAKRLFGSAAGAKHPRLS